MATITNIVLQSSANIVSQFGAITYTNVKFTGDSGNSILGAITYTNVKFTGDSGNSILGSMSYTNVKFTGDSGNSILGSMSYINVGVPRLYKIYKENWL